MERRRHTDPPDAPTAWVHVALTPQELRALCRAADLLADVLRPELRAHGREVADLPLTTAHQTLLGAAERAGVDCEASLIHP